VTLVISGGSAWAALARQIRAVIRMCFIMVHYPIQQ
jgi:hypothetical protein